MPTLLASFQNPSPAFRGKPFWSWNGQLRREELLRQIQVFRDMGLGGFFMHSRTGLITEYLGQEWFDLTNTCADEASKLGMEAWLYDEDRWPSGTAGGLVTQHPQFRAKFIRLRTIPAAEFTFNASLLAAFACKLDGLSYHDLHRLQEGEAAAANTTVLAFDLQEMNRSDFYNGFTYVDTMNPAATAEFLRLTHDRYAQRCGSRLGKSIQGIFTDEPHRGPLFCGFGITNRDKLWMCPWTPTLFTEFKRRFGAELVDHLPELFLQPQGRAISPIKWQFVELLQQLYLENFARPLHDWCARHNIKLTGHVLHEDDLTSQLAMQGSVMRFYEHMQLPGVDVLCEGHRQYWVVKQLTSVARQLNKKWLLSELYGCTGWQMSLRGHKEIGDWQALLGINVRCHHLSWYSMEGEAKRDYPASISHQSAWWKDYHHVETYFARLGVLLTHGQPSCEVLVLDPVESLWCQVHAGWSEGLSCKNEAMKTLERQYAELFHMLMGGHIDFDYGNEDMLQRLAHVERDEGTRAQTRLRVGSAAYRVVVVAGMTTIRSSTLSLLRQFANAGGTVLFVGDAPTHVDALACEIPLNLADFSQHSPWSAEAVRSAIQPHLTQRVEVIDPSTGKPIDDIFCQLREDHHRLILVALNTHREQAHPQARVRIHLRDAATTMNVTQWDLLRGQTFRVRSANRTQHLIEFDAAFEASESHAYVISEQDHSGLLPQPRHHVTESHPITGPFDYRLSEPNVCVLDFARWRLNDEPWQSSDEVLKIDRALRTRFSLGLRGGEMVQPWFAAKFSSPAQPLGRVTLAFDINIHSVPSTPAFLALERPDQWTATLNGVELNGHLTGQWWVDSAFPTIAIPRDLLRAGRNELLLSSDFAPNVNIEACYLLGDFGVKLEGDSATIIERPKHLRLGDLAEQGLPFYGGAITYIAPLPRTNRRPDAGHRLHVSIDGFEGACVNVGAPGLPKQFLAWPPYHADLTGQLIESDTVEIELVLTRRNTFGPLHDTLLKQHGYGPWNFVTEGERFTRNYMLYPAGLMKAPELARVKRLEDDVEPTVIKRPGAARS